MVYNCFIMWSLNVYIHQTRLGHYMRVLCLYKLITLIHFTKPITVQAAILITNLLQNLHTYMCMCACAYACIYTHRHRHSKHKHTHHTHTHTHAHTHTHTHTHMLRHTLTHACTQLEPNEFHLYWCFKYQVLTCKVFESIAVQILSILEQNFTEVTKMQPSPPANPVFFSTLLLWLEKKCIRALIIWASFMQTIDYSTVEVTVLLEYFVNSYICHMCMFYWNSVKWSSAVYGVYKSIGFRYLNRYTLYKQLQEL